MKENEPIVRLNILDLLILITKWRKLFILNFLLAAAISVVSALLLPKWYKATTIILPPGGGTSGIPSFLPSELKGVAMSFGLDVPSEEIYQTILLSRTLKERIIEKFDIRKAYNIDDEVFDEDVIEAFNSHLFITTLVDRSISIAVEDRVPERSAELANGCVEELDKIYSEITSETASKNRKFIETRLNQVRDSLAVLQDSVMVFQQTTGAISIPDQIGLLINSAADIKAQIVSNEIQIAVLRSSLSRDHPAVSQKLIQNRELNKKIDEILTGSEDGLTLGLMQLPELTRKYADLIRDVRIQRNLMEYIYPQYENARIQEDRETANVQTLDVARVPNRKSRPPRKLIVLISTAVSIIITLAFVLFIEYWRVLPERNEGDWMKIQRIIGFLRKN